MSTNGPPSTTRSPLWPWLALAVGLAWSALLRAPLIAHAADHLDSDLAVDGLVLIEAIDGNWRWHYPGTPHMGIPPVLLSIPQALTIGPGPEALVSGGTVAWSLVILAAFALAWSVFGPEAAGWSVVPLSASSVGTVWLSGRITGGHLLTLAWHGAAFAGLAACLYRGGRWRPLLLGIWCGFGLYIDTMILFTIAGIAPAAAGSWWARGRSRSGRVAALAFVVGLGIGVVPGVIGRRVDPYDPYGEQFAPTFEPGALRGHGRILAMECLPRLIAGHVLPGCQASPAGLSRYGRPIDPIDRGGPIGMAAVGVGLVLFAASVAGLATGPGAVRWGLLISAGSIVVGFLVNRNIFNSDNYRYLIFLLVPWAVGFGLLMRSIAARGAGGRRLALVLAGVLAAAMTASVASWYRGLGWLGGEGSGRVSARFEPRAGVTHVYGDYWHVYRYAFLAGGRVSASPFPTYPNRFEGWSRGLGPGEGALLLLDRPPDWRSLLAESWVREGRDPGELRRITIVNP